MKGADPGLPSTVLAGRYRVGPRLGSGGMADVFQAEDMRLGRAVAVKVLRAEHATDPLLRTRFESEARAVARLAHPNVVAVYDVGELDDGRPFIVMELVDGMTLRERLRSGPLDEASAVRLGLQVLAALGAAHAAGLLHRDIKPGNILLARDGTAKVADFGIAKAFGPDADAGDATTASVVLGTVRYLAPERAQGQPASVQSDLWAVGVVIYEALAGEHPFPGDTDYASFVAAHQGQLRPIDSVRPGVTPGTAAVLARVMAPDPATRYPSATAMADDLRAAASAPSATGGDATVAGEPPTSVLAAEPTWSDEAATVVAVPAASEAARWQGTRRTYGLGRLGWASAALLLLVILLAAFWPGGSSPTTPPNRAAVTTTTAVPTTTVPPSTTTTVSCSALRAQRQALDQPAAGGAGPQHGPGAEAAQKALDAQKHALDQQIQQLCGSSGG